jgi:hypothetical protein
MALGVAAMIAWPPLFRMGTLRVNFHGTTQESALDVPQFPSSLNQKSNKDNREGVGRFYERRCEELE